MSEVISYGLGFEVLKRLEQAGMGSAEADQIVGSRGNKLAKAMVATLNGQDVLAVETPRKKPDPFQLLTEFDVFVPDDYVHESCLATFKDEHGQEFYYFNPDATDQNFARVSVKLTPGKKLKVKAYGITRNVSSEEFLAKTKAKDEQGILVGAQGLTLVYKQAKDKLPKGKAYLSFDEKEKLPRLGGYHRVPCVFAGAGGDFDFSLGRFGGVWSPRYCLLVFCDSGAQSSGS